MADGRCLVTGATGYIGGRLVPHLLAAGHTVRVLARTPEKLDGVPWRDDVEIVQGDLDDLDSLQRAVADVDVVYHLVHAMGGSDDFKAVEARTANNMVTATTEQGVGRVVYLSGLHPEDPSSWSTHLASRIEVGRILLDSPVPAMVLQAGVVIGSGSASFELIRHLTERLPVMTTPKWVHNRIQPIAIRDVLHYLVAAATVPFAHSREWDIGSDDVMTYGGMMATYARVARLGRRHLLVLRPLTPTLASRWVGLVTPIPPGLARPLIESLECDAVMREHDIDELIPPPPGGLEAYEDAVREAIEHGHRGVVAPRWDDVDLLDAPGAPFPNDPPWSGELLFTHDLEVAVDAAEQQVHAAADVLVGTDIGLDRLTPVPTNVATALVTGAPKEEELGPPAWEPAPASTPDRLLLQARAPLPADVWLEMRTAPGPDATRVGLRLVCAPRGLGGITWWQAMLPLRPLALRRIAAAIRRAAPLQGTGPRVAEGPDDLAG